MSKTNSATNVADTNQFYEIRNSDFVYPVEFVVRTFLGSNYPNLKMDKSKYAGSKILDLGYGDGRNMTLLHNLNFDVYGVEISDEINDFAAKRFEKLGIHATLKVGRNVTVPFDDGFFQYVLACHSCYYIDEGASFETGLNEISRVLEKNGTFICSVPMHDTYILQTAEVLPDGYYRITHDPYGYRKGTIFRAFKDKEDIQKTFGKYFDDIQIGFCDDDFFGVHQKVWIVVARKK
jgi:ubiquinone/menaquinone biosynthesis C-methylase UbiE